MSARVAAQHADRATAEVLFERGMAAMEAADYARACALLEESEAADHGIGTMLYLADCYEQLGRTASAWATFRQAGSLASAAGQPERARAAQVRSTELERSLSTLAVTVERPLPGLVLERDSRALPASAWGVPVPVDPGEHTVVAHADGYVLQRERVLVGAAGAAVMHVVVPLLPEAPHSMASLPAPPPAADRPLRRNPWLWSAIGIVAASAAVTLGLVLRPERARSGTSYGGSTGDHLVGL